MPNSVIDDDKITKFFPYDGPVPLPPSAEPTDLDIDQTLGRVLAKAVKFDEQSATEMEETSDEAAISSTFRSYESYKTAEGMPEIPKQFYTAVGKSPRTCQNLHEVNNFQVMFLPFH